MSYQTRASDMMSDYMNVRTMPAMLSVAYVLASLYQFGGISQFTLNWIGGSGGYAITAEHAVIVSVAAFAVAFAGSQTRQLEHYETWEKLSIGLGPVVILGDYLTTEVTDLLVNIGDPLGMQVAFVLTVVSWAVALR